MRLVYLGHDPIKKTVNFFFVFFFLLIPLLGITQTFTKSGTVYEDYNGNKTFNTGESGTNAGGTLCAYLINNSTHAVLFTQAVTATGTYSFTVPALTGGASYIIAIGTCGITVGTIFTGGSSKYNDHLIFPSGWSNVFPADNRWKTAGNGTNSSNNFFIRKTPTAANVQSPVFPCNSSGCVPIPGLAGTAAAGNAAYNIENYKIIAIPSEGTLRSGSNTIIAGEIITAAEAANLCFIKTSGVGDLTFKYVAIDVAQAENYLSDTAIYTIRLGSVGFRRDVPSSVLLACNEKATTLYTPFTSDTTGYTFSYSWTGPSGFSSSVKNPVLAPNAAVENGLYIVTATDQNGCQAKDTLKAKKMSCFAFCDGGNAYIIKGTGSTNNEKLYKYNMNTGITTTASSSLTSIDAVCYNTYNNLIYGWAEGDSPSKHIYAVDAAGKQVDLGLSQDAALFDDQYFAGTAGSDGRWYLTKGQGDAILKVIDIDPKSSTYMRQVNQITVTGGTVDPWDITWNASDSMIYGVSGSQLYRINPRTAVVTTFSANVPGGDGSYGAQFMDYNYNHYISESSSGAIYKTSLAGGISGTVNFTLISGGPTGNYNDATVNPVQTTDFGDGPLSYGQAYHKFNCVGGIGSELLYLGSLIDYESTSMHSLDANGDDADASNDEDGVSAFPLFYPCNGTSSYAVTVSTHNTTGANAALSAWIDFNNNGLFDPSEKQQATIANGQTSVTITWPGITSSFIPGSYLYVRLRIATLMAEVNNPAGVASIGEVEDYRIEVMGRDEGDISSALYGTPVSLVFPDNNRDNIPDEAIALWLGTWSAANDGISPCSGVSNPDGNGDDNDGVDDEDGFIPTGRFVAGSSRLITFTANGNTHNQTGYYGLWIDWDNNGFQNSPNEFYTGTFTVGSPVTVGVSVTPPPGLDPVQIYFRLRVAPSPLIFSDFNSVLLNSETEDYFYENSVSSTLPVAFLDFIAFQSEKDVRLKWQTNWEQNNSGFEVQHSMDGMTWSTLYFVPSPGNSNTINDYNFRHINPGIGLHYYRVKQTDFDGTATFTVTRKVNLTATTDQVSVFPNPVRNKLFIGTSSSNALNEATLSNMLGQQVFRITQLQNNTSVDISFLPPGLYILKLAYKNEEPIYRKIIKEN